jgi:hypothetical protein
MSSSSSIPRSVLTALARQIRDNPGALRNVRFGDATTSISNVVTTTDLRIDVHKNSKDPRVATGIIQANSEAKNESVKKFIKGRAGGHGGTHQVIAKIPFYLGDYFNVDAFVNAVESGGSGGSATASGSASGTAAGATAGGAAENEQSKWTWMTDQNGRWHYYRLKSDGTGWEAWTAPGVATKWT